MTSIMPAGRRRPGAVLGISRSMATTARMMYSAGRRSFLAAAGVDVVFSDNTNATLVWSDAYPSLYETARAQQDGVNTPKISYFMPFAAGDATKYH